ncbi:cell adhesion molecule 3-like [Anneissia japonica]|uniref:cell adhesion molecule 3-like n=1 Tax=Anneissia japonica TaxID=1529436 RepID=UPI0014259E7E|nr:cell adhesion molecule 3-like [Anneissia japonica]
MFSRPSRTYFAKVIVITHLFVGCLAARFAVHPSDMTVREGDSIELSCKIRGLKEDQDVSWYRDDLELSRDKIIVVNDNMHSRYVVTSFPDGRNSIYVLKIDPTIRSDAGIYTCRILSNGHLDVRSKNASVVILQIPQQRYPECKISSNKITVNDLVTMNCSTERITPVVNISWTVNGTTVESNTLLIGNTTTIQYQFRARKTDHLRVFMCFLFSDVLEESRNCSVGQIDVFYPPTVSIAHTANNIIAGREIFMVCQSKANPPVTDYNWKFSPVIPDRFVFIDESTQVLRLVNTTSDLNNTIITCTASNEVGSKTDQVRLYIQAEKHTIPVTPAYTPQNYGSDQPDNRLADTISLPLPILVVCAVTGIVFVLVTTVIPIYILCMCNKKQNETKKDEVHCPIDVREMQEVLQPDHYFEPCDRVLPRIPDSEREFPWRKHIGVQVPDDDYDIASTSYTMYMTMKEPKRVRRNEQYRRYHTLIPMRL